MHDALVCRAGHAVLRAALRGGAHRFARDRGELEVVQRRMLAGLLQRVAAVDSRVDARWSWEAFRTHLPVTGWADWAPLIERQRPGRQRFLVDSPVERYQPTSGSTSAIKWVPYTRAFLGELDAAIAPWLADLYRQYPGVRQGRHYWSLSWLPTAMRAGQAGDLNDDMALLSSGKRTLTRLTQAVPQAASLARTSDGSLFVTLAFLAADAQLSALSVWSPTFALNLLTQLGAWRDDLADVLDSGRWHGRADGAGHLPCPRSPRAAALLRGWRGEPDPAFFRELWPRLALVSAWDTAASAPWAARLQACLPHAAFQGKGLWATEGVVTIPYEGSPLLAYRSHVFEFEDVASRRVLAPWELHPGQRVSPVLSTGSGLLRYRLSDIVEVEGFHGSIPRLRFIGRDDGTDLVGEKIAAAFVQQVVARLSPGDGLVPLTVVALDDAGAGKPGYAWLIEEADAADGTSTDPAAQGLALSEALERHLCGHFHYALARGLGQLAPAQVVRARGLRRLYDDHCRRHGMIEGNVKVEPLRHWRGPLSPALAALLRPQPAGAAAEAGA